jgi:hypothetical protein
MWLFGSGPRPKLPRRAPRYNAEWLQSPLGKIKDISTTGVCITGSGKPTVTKGKITQVKLLTPGGELNFLGRVVWVKRVKGGFEAGLELLNVKPHVAERLRTLGELGFVPAADAAYPDAAPGNANPLPAPAGALDPYSVLEIDATSTDSQILRAYRRLVRLYHPDINKSAEAVAKFEQVVEAYHKLKKSTAKVDAHAAGRKA